MILAGIDIGTNTLRLLIADAATGHFREIISDRRITRLGQDLEPGGILTSEAIERSLDALVAFQDRIKQQDVRYISAIGTSALRRARNSSVFIDRVKKRTGFVVRIISGEEEARLTLLGVEQSLAMPNRAGNNALTSKLVVDIGGGSTELILITTGRKPRVASLKLGAVYLYDRFIKHDPPTPEDLARLMNAVVEELNASAGSFKVARDCICIGTAGTITTLAAMCQGLTHYDTAKINRFILTREFINATVMNLGALKIEERKKIRGLESGREDIIISGAIITQEIMRFFGLNSMVVSDWGLREGIIIDLLEKLNNRS